MIFGILDWSGESDVRSALQNAISRIPPKFQAGISCLESPNLALAGVHPVEPLGSRSEDLADDSGDLRSWNEQSSWILLDSASCRGAGHLASIGARTRDPAGVIRAHARGCRDDFAAAWWDAQEQALVLIRDAMGLRPLFFHHAPPRTAFATNLAVLRSLLPDLNQENPVYLAHMLCLDTEVGTHTGWRDLQRVPAGGFAYLGHGRPQAWTDVWWKPELDADLPGPRDGDWPAAMREKLLSAVARRLPDDRGDVLASFLSGGLDSSSIVGAIREVTRDRDTAPSIHTLSFRFPGLPERERLPGEETWYQEAVSRFVGATSHVIRGDLSSPVQGLDRFLQAISEPWVAPNRYLHHAGLRVAGQLEASVVFDGIDGDSAIGNGVERFEELVRSLRWLQLVREAKKFTRNAPSRRHTVASVLREYALPALVPAAWRRRREIASVERAGRDLMQLLSSALRDREDVQKSLRARSLLPQRHPHSMIHRHAAGLRLKIFDLATSQLQALGMSYGVRVAFPFFDRDLLELSLAAPLDQKLRHGWPRYILREAVSGIVPDEVRWRRHKANLGAQFFRGLMTTDRPFVEALLQRTEPALEPYVDIDRLRDASEDLFEREDRSRAMQLLAVVTLARWLELRDADAV